ncbi:hypothetical protein C3L50_05830 [Flavobacterium alvei]|uniref:Uncharacterized protein n=1 Tax=Flavobacterium alvei TaxID=2080416 RepID=A0A2S5AC88_9FLAO|nr:hypothetical protein [Flavobacterium alvei]POY40165.1 hypothetical protein C3L50_05830 [Flavobacterium alvei]
MKRNIQIILFLLLINLSFTSKVSAQIAIDNIEELSKIKGGTTYVAMKDPNAEKSKEYVEIFKNNWTYTKLEFIKYTDITKYIAPGNSFLTLSGYVTDVQMMSLYNNGIRPGIDYSHTHIFLQLWTVDDNYFKKNKEFNDKDRIQIARLELYTDFETIVRPSNLYQNDYDADNHIRNWGPGILKNHIQNLNTYLNTGKKKSLFSDILNEKEIKKLASETLYIPDYILVKFNKFTGDESAKLKEEELLEDYKFKYKMLSTKELNDKILSDTKGFYYLQYIKSSTNKYISVINSLTGEIIYSIYVPVSYNLKSDDLKDLSKIIQKIN